MLVINILKIKTKCGIDKYNKLKQNKSILGKIRLFWFKIFAIIRDFDK